MSFIENRLHEAMLRGVDGITRCRRCGRPWTPLNKWKQVIVVDDDRIGEITARYLLCTACRVDFEWFIDHPPEMPPDTSSDDTLEETKEDECPDHGSNVPPGPSKTTN